MRRTWVVPAALMTVTAVGLACGGSMVFTVDGPLIPATAFAERALYPLLDLLESTARDEVRFLPGLLRADSIRFAGLIGRPPLEGPWWDTTTRTRVAEPAAVALDAAWRRGDLDGAVRAAGEVVGTIMSLPFYPDSARDAVMRRAVETIEIAPTLRAIPAAGRAQAFERAAAPFRGISFDSLPMLAARAATSPRRASIEYAALRGAVRRDIPDDTRDAIVKQVPAARWDSLHAAHRRWLATYPDHPYAALVRFSRLRLFFLAMQADSAWATAFALYPQYPARTAAEMRYMLLTLTPPPGRVLTDARVPLEVRTALVGNLRPSASEWSALMREASSRGRDRLGESLEERLLGMLASDTVAATPLPDGFPAWRATATPLWRYLWAVNMLRAGRVDDAMPFVSVPITARDDTLLARDAAMLTARLHLQRRSWRAAAGTPGLDEWTRRYIVRVLVPDSVMASIRAGSSREAAREARLVLAVRAAQAGRWADAAAEVRAVDARRSALYARIGGLAGDTVSDAGLLRFADALAGAHGQLFFEASRYYYRGMMYRDYTLYPRWQGDSAKVWDLPWSKETERARMFQSLRDGAERYLALKAYVSYLGRPGLTVAQRRSAVRAADRVYRGLLATDPSRVGEGYWADSLPVSAEARTIRAAGRR